MNNTAISLSFVLLTVAFAGCFAESDGAGEAGLDTTSTSAALSDPPRAKLVVTIDGNETMEDMNGPIPAKAGANITFDASASTGETLTFGWDFGDGETAGTIPKGASAASKTSANSTSANATGNATGNATLGAYAPLGFVQQPNGTANASANKSKPGAMGDGGAVVVHSYLEAGNYTVTLYVSDANDQVDMEGVDLTVGTAAGTVLRVDTRTFKDAPTCSAADQVLGATKTSTFTWTFYANETDGTPSQVANVTIKGGPADTKFMGPDGKEIASGATIEAEGPFPAGDYKITAASKCAAGSSSRTHTLTASSTHVAT